MTLPSRLSIFVLLGSLFALFVLGPSALAQTIELDDTATLTIEEGATGQFSVDLSEEPSASVTVTLTSDNDDVTLDPTSLTFMTDDWDEPQDVEVSAEHDDDADDDTATITLSASGGITAPNVTKEVSVDDDDTASIELDETGTLTIDEGGSGKFNVDLSVEPSASVTVTLTSDDDDVTMVPASLTFTTTDWDDPKEVEVSAAHDDDADDETVTITLEATGGITAPNVTKEVSVDDDETAGNIVLDDTDTLEIKEGESGKFKVDLSVQPDDDVTVALTSDNTDVTVAPASLTFTTTNWNNPIEVTVSVADDSGNDDETATITLSATGGIVAADVEKEISVDDDEPPSGNIDLDNAGTLAIDEEGSGEFNVKLSVQPDANVTVTLTSNNADVTVSPASLTFTTTNWNQLQEVEVSAEHDHDADDETATITLKATGGIRAADVTKSVSVEDDDPPLGNIVLDNTATLAIDESGTGKFNVDLSAEPDASVTVTLTSNNADVTMVPASLTFTTTDWNQPQEVVVSAAHDDGADDDTATITLKATGGIRADDVTKEISVDDDDTVGILLSARALPIIEGDLDHFQVKLLTRPTADIKMNFTPPNSGIIIDTELEKPGYQNTSLVFKRSGQEDAWNVYRRVMVYAALDDANPTDGSFNIEISVDPEDTSKPSDYDAEKEIVVVNVSKRPVGNFVLDPARTIALIEGDSITLAVSLDTEPNEDDSVSVNLAHTLDPSHLRISPTSLIFTTSNYKVPQMVTIIPRQDRVDADHKGAITVEAISGIRANSTLDITIENAAPRARIVLSESGPLVMPEGQMKELTVKLDAKPIGPIEVALIADHPDISFSRPILTFTERNYNVEQLVVIASEQDVDLMDEDIAITLTATGGIRASDEMIEVSVIDDDKTTPDWPVKAQALALAPSDAQDDAILRLHCKEEEIDCAVHLKCAAQLDGTIFEGSLPQVPARGALTLSVSDIEGYLGRSWSNKGRLGCFLHSEQNIDTQVWTRSGDGVLVNNSAFIRSVREGEMYRADIESIPSPDEMEESNIRIRCTSTLTAPRCAISLACYDDAGRRYDGDLGTIERLRVRHLQSEELSRLIGHRWSGVGLSCEIRSDRIFTVQVMTRTGGGGALVNNSAGGGSGSAGN